MIASNVLLADPYVAVDEIRSLAEALNDNADNDTQRRLVLLEKIKKLEDSLENNIISSEEAAKDIKALQLMVDLERRETNKIQEKYGQIQDNFDRYIFKTRAQKFLPFLYAIAAVRVADDGPEKKAIYALAGYGTGALIENTGYGLSNGVTFLRYSFDF